MRRVVLALAVVVILSFVSTAQAQHHFGVSSAHFHGLGSTGYLNSYSTPYGTSSYFYALPSYGYGSYGLGTYGYGYGGFSPFVPMYPTYGFTYGSFGGVPFSGVTATYGGYGGYGYGYGGY